MSNRNPDSGERSLLEAIQFAIAQAMKGLSISLPGIVQEYDADTRRAKVQPAIDIMLTNAETMAQPVLEDVPVIMPAGGGFVVHFPLAAGDAVMLLFSQRGIDEFKASYARAKPERAVIFNIKDAVAYPAFGSLSPSLPSSASNSLVLSREDGSEFISLGAGGVTIQTAGELNISASAVRHGGTNIGNTHTHGGVFPGGSSTGGPS